MRIASCSARKGKKKLLAYKEKHLYKPCCISVFIGSLEELTGDLAGELIGLS